MAAFPTFDPCEAVMQDTAVQVSVNDLFHIGPKKAILLGKALIKRFCGYGFSRYRKIEGKRASLTLFALNVNLY